MSTLVPIIILSAIATSNSLQLLHSKLMGKAGFNAPINVSGLRTVSLIGLLTNAFEDLPQVCIQIALASQSGAPSLELISYLSLTASCFSLGAGLLRRGILACVFRKNSFLCVPCLACADTKHTHTKRTLTKHTQTHTKRTKHTLSTH